MKKSILFTATSLAALTFAGGIWYTTSCPDRRIRIAEVECRDKESDLEHVSRDGDIIAHSTPRDVFVFQEVVAMICDYAIITCPKTGALCDHRNCMEDCARAKLDRDSHITFSQCLKVYEDHSDVGADRKRKILKSVRKSLALLGLDESASVDVMSYRRFKDLIAILKDRVLDDGRHLCEGSIYNVLMAFRAVTSEKLRDNYEDLGYSRPIFDMPKIRIPKKKVRIMTPEQDCKVDDWMRRLSVSSDPIEQRIFVALWFERLFGVRPNDINRLTWDCIVFDGSKVKLVYKPHKTEKFAGRDDPIIVPLKLWSWVEPYYVKGGLLLPRLRSARRAVSNNRAIWDRINKQFRAWGICDHESYGKASYINRRQRITEAFEKDGWRGATAIGKNTPKVQIDHYVAIGEYAA